MTDESSKVLTGFHGTDSNNIDSIFKNNFRISENNDDWLGFGVYFFLDGGLNIDPVEKASDWAVCSAFQGGTYCYENYAVLKACSHCTKVFDARIEKNLILFQKFRNKLIEQSDRHFYNGRDISSDNRVIWNLLAKAGGLDAIIHNVYIKTKVERILKISSNVPTSTIMCVKDPTSIDQSSIKVVKECGVRDDG